ncbi:VCBS repeat-containing protein [Paenibacillus filicis]|uniref:VCBS repeat-containing protein n=1 Tax=Paenibacillus gyeongsangnamensis TaxID=3388067 RepID=A0ABT4QLT3_9BACL|nr:VCBS repeat-containing protein [Paenibacillus filicis]MCZ8517818.1 VCBS repeat-containing protein [Paenibacillus filicis]
MQVKDLGLATPYFEQQLVEDHRKDGYWIEALDIDKDGKPDLIGYGLGEGEVGWYENPGWERTPIAKLEGPVGMHYADVNGNGLLDVIICYQYGKTMIDCDPDGGKIIWMENPGNKTEEWKHHYIGRATAMHRLKVGHFTQNERLEVLALPIVGKPQAVHSDVPVLLFTQPEDVYSAEQWEGTIIDDSYFHVIHGVTVKNFESKSGMKLDSVLLATQEGITWLYYDSDERKWQKVPIGAGELGEESKTGFKGSGDVDTGKIGSDSFAYIAAVEPFHGNTIAVYCKQTDNELTKITWKRVVLDVYGDPNQLGEGPAHFVVCADFDGDGDDEFLVALRGPVPWQGVVYYKAIDVKNGVFVKWHVSSASAARIAVADYDGDGRLDFATIGYSVNGYYTADDSQISVYYNRFAEALRGNVK